MTEKSSVFDQQPLIIGHRGAAGLLPENTLPGFTRAAALGVGAVELDIHLCEGELIVIHDDSLDRTTNGRGPLAGQSLAALRSLDAGDGARIPTLAEVFATLPAGVGINIELKGSGTAEPLAAWLPDPAERDILLSSFNHGSLQEFVEIRQDYPLAPLFGRWQANAIQTALGFGSGYINLGQKLATPSRLRTIEAAGLRALVYTVNELRTAKRLFAMGVWGVFTDFPDRISVEAIHGTPG